MPELKDLINTILIDEPSPDVDNDKLLLYDDSADELKSTKPGAVGGGAELGSLFFDALKYNNINCGVFWRQSVENSHCFWQFIVQPVKPAGDWTGYFLSDTQGGEHHLLIGCAVSGNSFTFTGNLNSPGSGSFTSPESFPLGQAYHVAIGWDGTTIMLWVNGILSLTVAWSGPRQNLGGNNGCLHIGGSDHNHFWGYIEQIEGYEGFGRCCYDTDFRPERHFRPLSASSSLILDVPQFQHNYQTEQSLYIDTSEGFEGVHHHGVKSAIDSAIIAGEESPPFNHFDLPVFVPGELQYAQVTPTAPATPSGALVWDSFSRLDCTYVNTNLLETTVTQSTEGGSLGPFVWTSLDQVNFPDATLGILNGKAVLFYSHPHMGFDTGVQDVDIRVDRLSGFSAGYTSILFRYVDNDDYYAIWGNETSLNLRKRESGVNTDVPITPTAGWTTLRIVANGTNVDVYTGTATEGIFTLEDSETITDLPGATTHGLYNFNNVIKLVARADNFLIKAA